MIIVVGEAVGRLETIDELRRASIEHVRRSRTEDGCIEHSVFVDCENEQRLFFFERWRDAAALKAHFAVEDARLFAKALGALTARKPRMTIYNAEETAAG